MKKTSSHRRRLDRLERLQSAVREGKPLLHSPGLSMLLSKLPVREYASTPTATEAAWMRQHRDLIAATCQPRPERSLADCLINAREQVNVARRLMDQTV